MKMLKKKRREEDENRNRNREKKFGPESKIIFQGNPITEIDRSQERECLGDVINGDDIKGDVINGDVISKKVSHIISKEWLFASAWMRCWKRCTCTAH